MSEVPLPQRKPVVPETAEALRGPTQSQTLPEAEHDYRGIGPIPANVLSGEEPFPDPYKERLAARFSEIGEQPEHPLARLAQAEEFGRKLRGLTAEMDEALFPDESDAQSGPASPGERMNWTGTQREFADLMDSLRRTGKIEARNETDIIRQLVQHFVHRGKPMNENSLRVNLQQRRDQIAGRKK